MLDQPYNNNIQKEVNKVAKKKKSRKKQLLRQANRKRLQENKATTAEKTVIKPTTADKPAQRRQKAPIKGKLSAKTIDQEIEADAKSYTYVKNDLSRIGLIVLILAGVVVVVWFILVKTDMGEQLYRSIKI